MKELILLVDDEDIIRMTSGEILKELGFDVITADNGETALALYRDRKDEISIVILDMTLPDISGIELFNEMKKIPSSSKFLLTSGYRRDMTGTGHEAVFIQKPYTISELSKKIDEVSREF